MKALALALVLIMFATGCATTFYVGPGQEQSFKSREECQLAHPDDSQYCVNRAEYIQTSQNTVALVLYGILTAVLVVLTIGAFTK